MFRDTTVTANGVSLILKVCIANSLVRSNSMRTCNICCNNINHNVEQRKNSPAIAWPANQKLGPNYREFYRTSMDGKFQENPSMFIRIRRNKTYRLVWHGGPCHMTPEAGGTCLLQAWRPPPCSRHGTVARPRHKACHVQLRRRAPHTCLLLYSLCSISLLEQIHLSPHDPIALSKVMIVPHLDNYFSLFSQVSHISTLLLWVQLFWVNNSSVNLHGIQLVSMDAGPIINTFCFDLKLSIKTKMQNRIIQTHINREHI